MGFFFYISSNTAAAANRNNQKKKKKMKNERTENIQYIWSRIKSVDERINKRIKKKVRLKQQTHATPVVAGKLNNYMSNKWTNDDDVFWLFGSENRPIPECTCVLMVLGSALFVVDSAGCLHTPRTPPLLLLFLPRFYCNILIWIWNDFVVCDLIFALFN